jgi:hypothetical protein
MTSSLKCFRPEFPIWSYYPAPQDRRLALMFLVSDATNPATKGDTLRVRKESEPFQFTFNGFLKVAFQGSRVTSDAGSVLVRELDERRGVEAILTEHLRDSRHGLNTQFLTERALVVVGCDRSRVVKSEMSA